VSDIKKGPATATNREQAPMKSKRTYRHTASKPKINPTRKSWVEAGSWLHIEGPTGNTVFDTWFWFGEPMRGRR
jgi:hypothetical protein